MEYLRKKMRSNVDWTNAAKIFKLATSLDSIEGKWRYARCLSQGFGILQNVQEAIQIFFPIKDQNNFAKFFLALCFTTNDDTRKQIIQELVDQNDPNGQWALGISLLDSNEHEDQMKGAKLLMQAASSGKKSYHEKLEQFIKTNQYRFLKQSIKGRSQPQAIIKTHFEDDEFFYLLDPMTDPILKKNSPEDG
jgi:TPR repeat protein